MKAARGIHVSTLRRISLSLLVVALLSGCGLRAMDAQQVLLDPVLDVAQSDLGKGTPVAGLPPLGGPPLKLEFGAV